MSITKLDTLKVSFKVSGGACRPMLVSHSWDREDAA